MSFVEALTAMLADLRLRYPSIVNLARHSDLDSRRIPAEDDPGVLVRRRLDPGPMFPWFEISEFWKTL